jgi:hypothetical protein
MIDTKTYQLTQDVFTKIVMQRLFVKKWWLFALFLVIGCYYCISPEIFDESPFLTFMLFGYPLFYIGYTFFWSRSKNHQGMFAETDLAFNESEMLFKKNDNEVKIPYKNILRVEDFEKHWLLYISKMNFIYIPKDIFYLEEDFTKFKSYINA